MPVKDVDERREQRARPGDEVVGGARGSPREVLEDHVGGERGVVETEEACPRQGVVGCDAGALRKVGRGEAGGVGGADAEEVPRDV